MTLPYKSYSHGTDRCFVMPPPHPAPRFRNNGRQKNTGHDRYPILIYFPSHPTPYNFCSRSPAVQTFLRLTSQANSETMPQYFKAQWLAYTPPRSTEESLHFVHAEHLHIPQNLSITVAVSLYSNDSSL